MNKNLGTTDRILRTIAGLVIIGYGIINHTWLGAIGAVPLLTALVGIRPAYCPFGISTAGKGGGCCGGK